MPPPLSAMGSRIDIESLARTHAATDPVELDRLVERHVAAAVREHRVEDAVRWQRVRLRARSIRSRREVYGIA